MCTLSFVPSKKEPFNFIMTSNRDESPGRETIPPKKYSEMGSEMWYPKDEVAGGTWIGVSSKKRLVCLMNGGFGRHQRKKTYRKSRGVVVKELLSAAESAACMERSDFTDIEPFTIVVVDWTSKLALWQLIWDGTEKHLTALPIKPYIWSASMLYSEATKKERAQLFDRFIAGNREGITVQALFDFHQQFKIDRGVVKTTSITQFVHRGGISEMVYHDLKKEKIHSLKR